MFCGREKELGQLNDIYSCDGFKSVYLYGEENLGKSTLVKKFANDKDCFLFSAYDATTKYNLSKFSKRAYNFFNISEATGSFNSWHDAFQFINKNAKTYKFLTVIDNAEKLIAENSSFCIEMAEFIENYFVDNNFMLILIFNYKEFSEKIVSNKSELWGKQDLSIKLEELDMKNSLQVINNMEVSDKIRLYGCIGGVPGYLAQINTGVNSAKNIKEQFLTKTGYLFLDIKLVIRQNIREPGVYNSILNAMAVGAAKSGEISEITGIDRNKLSKYLDMLQKTGLIIKEIPYGDDPFKGRKGKYKIRSKSIKFWYKFVFPNIFEIELENNNYNIPDDELNKEIDDYLGGEFFKEISMQYLMAENKKFNLPFFVTGFKSWWGDNMDVIVGYNHQLKSLLVNSYIFGESKDDIKKIVKCKNLSEKFSLNYKVYFYFFSNRDFSDDAYKTEKEDDSITLLYL